MYKNKKILAIIPAREGSKEIPLKNICLLKGRTLIEYTIDCANDSQYIDRIIISTDSQLIKNVANQYIRKNNKRIDIPFMRPKEISGDTSKTIDCVLHAIDWLYQKEGMCYDYIVILQVTSPLRKSFHIDEAIELLLNTTEESLVSINEVTDNPILVRAVDKNNFLKKILDTDSTIRRQDFRKYYKVNGAIYIIKNNKNLNAWTSLNDSSIGYIMDKKYSIDIDNALDIKIAEISLQNENC